MCASCLGPSVGWRLNLGSVRVEVDLWFPSGLDLLHRSAEQLRIPLLELVDAQAACPLRGCVGLDILVVAEFGDLEFLAECIGEVDLALYAGKFLGGLVLYGE